MIDQIRLLEELQQIDAKIEEHGQAAAAVPARLDEMRENLRRIENLLAEERQRLAEAEKHHADQERELRMEEEQIQKAKVKLQQVRNPREYMATTRELEILRKMSGDREEEMLKMMEAVDKSRVSLKQHDTELTDLRRQVADEEKAAQDKTAELAAALAEARTARESLTAKVRPDVMKRYQHIRLRRGLAVVPVRNGTCAGCNRRIPPQLYNQLIRGEDMFTCPVCHRLIYYEAGSS